MNNTEQYRLDQGRSDHAQALTAVLTRSATDTEFRTRLLSDPRAAIEEATGRDVPADMDIRFVENDGFATIVLPDFAGSELSDNQLEAVAGGDKLSEDVFRAAGTVTRFFRDWGDNLINPKYPGYPN